MSVQSMDTQVSVMDPDIKFTCPFCNEEFGPEEQDLLREHMKATHLKQMIACHRQQTAQSRPRKVTHCLALGCSETNENKQLSFFYLPRRPRSLVWLINAGRYDLLSTPVEVYVHHKICSSHFEMDQCLDTLKTRVSVKAVPTIFNHSLEVLTAEVVRSKGAEVPAKRIERQYSNSLIEEFQDIIIHERGSKTKMFSITIVAMDEQYNHREIKSRPATKVFKGENKALIYKLLQGKDVYKISESIFCRSIKSKYKTSASKRGNAYDGIEVNITNRSMSEFLEDNCRENYQIFSLEDIDPLLQQDNCGSDIQLSEEIVNNDKETSIPEITITDTALHNLISVPDLETVNISENVQENFLEHDYCSVSGLCRLCATELQGSDERSVVDVLQSLHPLFQKCLDLFQDFKDSDCLPEKVCSVCVEKLQRCDPLFQQISETNVKLKTFLRWTEKHPGSNNMSRAGSFQSDKQMEECAEVTNECAALDEPSQELSDRYVCNECPNSRVYKTLMDLRCHIALVHEADTNSGKTYKWAYPCKYCKRKYRSLKEFYYHPCQKKKRPDRPEHPPVQRILKTVYTRRYKRHADGYVCCTCGHVAPSEVDIKTHWRSHIPSLPPRQPQPYTKREPTYGCHICGRRFTLELHLNQHLEMHPKWHCKTCGKLFKSPMLLGCHKRKHEPDFIRLCHLCGKMFANIRQHTKNVHSTTLKPKKTIVCHICGKEILKHYLKRHIHAVHERVNKNIPCPHCQKTCRDECALKSHIYKVHTSKHFKCELCSKVYKKRMCLEKHVNKQHPACKLCQKRFSTKDDKTKHEFLEHNEGSGCEWSSDIEDSMREHKELEEEKEKTYLDEFALKKHTYISHATIRCFNCEFCNKAFKAKVFLEKHVEKLHPACNLCQKRFPSKDARSKHEVLEHNYSLEEFQALSASVEVILTTGDALLPRNW